MKNVNCKGEDKVLYQLKERKRALGILAVMIIFCVAVGGLLTEEVALGAVQKAPAYTAPEIVAESDAEIAFGNLTDKNAAVPQDVAAYMDSITAVALKDVKTGGGYQTLTKGKDWQIAPKGYVRRSAKYNPADGTTSYTYIYGSVLMVSYRLFEEELTAGTEHKYKLKIQAAGYADLEIDLNVVARSAKDLIVRVFDSEANAKAGKAAYQKVLTEAEILAMPQRQADYTMYCGMVGLGAARVEGVYFKDILAKALVGSGYQFVSGDSIKFRVTDELYDANYNKKQKSAYDIVLDDLTKLKQNAWYEKTHTYETIFARRYYFPGIFAGFKQLVADGKVANITDGSAYDYAALLQEPKSVEGAKAVEPMLAVKSARRILDRTMAGSEQFPNCGGSLAGLAQMGMNRNDGYRFVMGQQMAAENGRNVISDEATRFLVAYNIFGIDIIKGQNAGRQAGGNSESMKKGEKDDGATTVALINSVIKYIFAVLH